MAIGRNRLGLTNSQQETTDHDSIIYTDLRGMENTAMSPFGGRQRREGHREKADPNALERHWSCDQDVVPHFGGRPPPRALQPPATYLSLGRTRYKGYPACPLLPRFYSIPG
ncbi:hypothetical protein AAG570_007516 [Ranatra chinensis]|uniref:Uncharacterized protein n=1 Tax=Ranatra chinensis TaxID=642074 RepID=A0ABD0XW41_9HEMI